MTVAELIDQLKRMSPDLRVVVRHWNASSMFENAEVETVTIKREDRPGFDSGGLFDESPTGETAVALVWGERD